MIQANATCAEGAKWLFNFSGFRLGAGTTIHKKIPT
jgi:hypothetical protein